MTNYKDMIDKLINKKTFKGNSVTAIWQDYVSDTGRLDKQQCYSLLDWLGSHSGSYYIVLSYSTPILIKDKDGNSWINTRKYSTTTSKIQNIIKRIEHIEEL